MIRSPFAIVRALRQGAAVSAACLLAGCSALSALDDATETLEVYTLRAPQAGPAARRPSI